MRRHPFYSHISAAQDKSRREKERTKYSLKHFATVSKFQILSGHIISYIYSIGLELKTAFDLLVNYCFSGLQERASHNELNQITMKVHPYKLLSILLTAGLQPRT